MREILFRGKHKDSGEWVEGVPYFENNQCFMITDLFICEEYQCTGAENVEVIPETIGQYTGLTDKNGKRIFENGYVIIDNKTYKVIFDNAEYILTNIFGCDIITLKNNSIKGVFVDEI